jgi:(p)ppGpp synthase/HD superfamily hydrolase
MVCAALLHNLLEETACDPEDLRAEFGDEIADLVHRLTALQLGSTVPDDDRVITLKLLDRLHNMRTIEYTSTGKQLSKSRETLELLVPHARRLGLPVIADELRDLARHRIKALAGESVGEITATLCASDSARFSCPQPPGPNTWKSGPLNCRRRPTGIPSSARPA